MPSLTGEAQRSVTTTHTDSKDYDSLAVASGSREVLQVTTVSELVIRSTFAFTLPFS